MKDSFSEVIKQQTILNKNYHNFILPCKYISQNIISHKISLSAFKKLYNMFGIDPKIYSEVRYYCLDTIMSVNQKGRKKCYKDSVNFKYYSGNLGFVKFMRIPLSIERFNVSHINHKSQYINIDFDLNDIILKLEIILDTVKKDIDPAEIINKLMEKNNTNYVLSYRVYIKDVTAVNKYLLLLNKLN